MGKMKQFDERFEDFFNSSGTPPEEIDYIPYESWLTEFENKQEERFLKTMYTLHQNCRAENDD